MMRRLTRLTIARLMLACALALAGWLQIGAADAASRALISDLSDRVVEIGSDFAGSDILVFGAIAPDLVASGRPNQIVIVLRGENRTQTVRRKERVAGIWINRRAATFTRVPALYLLATTEPLDTIAPQGLLQREEIGLDNLALPFVIRTGLEGDDIQAFRGALIRQRMETGLFREREGIVTLIDGVLFRGSLRLPPTVPTGRYKVSIYLLRDGRVVARDVQRLKVERAGLEQRISRMAERRPFLYGLIAVLMALSAGWVGSTILRNR